MLTFIIYYNFFYIFSFIVSTSAAILTTLWSCRHENLQETDGKKDMLPSRDCKPKILDSAVDRASAIQRFRKGDTRVK